MTTKKKKRVNIRVSAEAWRELQKRADAEGRSIIKVLDLLLKV